MCKLCKKIFNKQELEKWFEDWYNENKIYNVIHKTEKGEFEFFTYIDDHYYTPQTRFFINYCPVCGRKLDE